MRCCDEDKGAVKANAQPDYERMRREAAAFDDEMRQLAERRANHAVPPSVVRDWAVIPDKDVRGIVHDNQAPQGPSAQGVIPSSQQMSNVRGTGGVPGGGTGWAREIPLGPSVHQRYVDAQLDAQDRRDLHERIVAEAERNALTKAAEKSK
jgi:hypothetical protein